MIAQIGNISKLPERGRRRCFGFQYKKKKNPQQQGKGFLGARECGAEMAHCPLSVLCLQILKTFILKMRQLKGVPYCETETQSTKL